MTVWKSRHSHARSESLYPSFLLPSFDAHAIMYETATVPHCTFTLCVVSQDSHVYATSVPSLGKPACFFILKSSSCLISSDADRQPLSTRVFGVGA